MSIDKNCFQQSAGDKLSIPVTTLKNLKDFRIDENIVSRKMVLKLTTDFSTAACRTLRIYNPHYQSTEAITVTGSLHNITTLTLFKCFVKVQDVLFLAGVLKTGVMFSLWDQDNALSRAGVIGWLSSSKHITTIKLLNGSRRRLTEQEEDTVVTIIRENTQLENVLLDSRSSGSVINDFIAYNSELKHKINNDSNHCKPVSTNETGKPMFLSLEFLFKIISALKYHANLKALNLSVCTNNVITKELTEQLAIVLANSTQLETLMLEDCSLGNKGLNVIINSLKDVSTLKYLDLSNNDVTKDGLIISILEANTGLEKLHLHKNCLHSTAGGRLIIPIVHLKKLKELSIDKYVISRNMALKLATTFSFTTERNLFIYDHDNQAMERMNIKGPLSSVDTLTMSKDLSTELDLSTGARIMTFISVLAGIVSLIWGQCTTGVLRFLSSLKQITTIEFCNINGSGVTELEVDTIATVISENVQLENVLLCSYFVNSIMLQNGRISTEKTVSISTDDTTVNKIPQLFPNRLE